MECSMSQEISEFILQLSTQTALRHFCNVTNCILPPVVGVFGMFGASVDRE